MTEAETEIVINDISSTEPNWVDREKELLAKISNMEIKSAEENNKNVKCILNLEHEIQSRNEERENYKNKIQLLESELADIKNNGANNLSPAQQNQVDKVKQMSEEMLTKAKGVIFDKTKICKNQELQIEALTAQVNSLKDVLSITRELLDIRNIEVGHLQDKLNCMDLKISTERERRDLMEKKLDAMVNLNKDLKEEYQIQLRIFNALKNKYSERDDQKTQEQDTEKPESSS